MIKHNFFLTLTSHQCGHIHVQHFVQPKHVDDLTHKIYYKITYKVYSDFTNQVTLQWYNKILVDAIFWITETYSANFLNRMVRSSPQMFIMTDDRVMK